MNINKFIGLASAQADKSGHNHFKHGSIICYKDKVISRGYNNKKNVPLLRSMGYRYPFPHAEIEAILKVDKKELKNATVFVVRKTKTKLGNSKPCVACANAMLNVGIKDVFYSNAKGDIEYMVIQ